MVKVARARVVDGQGDEVEASETPAEASESHGEEQTQLARIVLPPSSSMVPPPMAADAPSSSSRNDGQEAEGRSKPQGNAAVAATAILPLARKDIKRAQAA